MKYLITLSLLSALLSASHPGHGQSMSAANEKKILMYLQVVIIDHTAIVMQGQATANFPVYLKDFQA
ncbi:MAG TPA: hypothetical protein VHC96_01095 [Puia sp.]|jgi:hypothetical protein|nr:hypothetical protein [Puia sp.]